MPKNLTDLVKGMSDVKFASTPLIMVGLFAAGLYGFLAIADEVSENEIAAIDSYLLLMLRTPGDVSRPLGPPWLQETMTEITSLGGYPVLVILVGVVLGFLLVSKKFGPALFACLSIVTGTALGHVLKLIYDRPRPDIVDHLVTTHTASFPSGHATMSAVVYLTLASLIVRLVEDTVVRVYVISIAVLLTVAIGISRIYLGVHWPSDVAAGWALGVAWASLSSLVVTGLRFYRHRNEAS